MSPFLKVILHTFAQGINARLQKKGLAFIKRINSNCHFEENSLAKIIPRISTGSGGSIP